jgi:hypothetical protein
VNEPLSPLARLLLCLYVLGTVVVLAAVSLH